MPDQQSPPRLIRDLMTVGVPICLPDTLVVDIVRMMLEKDLEAVVIEDEEKHAVGLVTRDELVQAYGRGEYEMLTAEDIMQVEVPQILPDLPLQVAAQIMQDRGVRVLYLMHHAGGVEYPAAALTYKHFLRHMAMQEEEDLADLGIYAKRKPPLESFLERRDEVKRKRDTNQT